MVTGGCEGAIIPPSEAQERPPGGPGAAEAPPAVDVATAATANGQELRDYLGTTRPHRAVAVRSRIEGPLLSLTADVGDAVGQGQVLARLDDRLLATESSENAAAIAALELEVSAAQARVGEAQARVEEVRVQVGQARADVARFNDLVSEGALPERELETAKSTLAGLEKSLQAAQQQVRQQQETVAVARKRVVAQRAIAAGSSERQSFSVVRSPISGQVLARVLEPGSLAQPGSEILTLGDFSQLEIEVRLTDRDLAAVRPGLAVQVRFDAFPDETFTGRVTRISPTADPVARQIPVEVTIPNPGGRIGGGLLARVQFAPTQAARVAIPEQALSAGSSQRRGGGRGGAAIANNAATGDTGKAATEAATTGQVFLVQGDGDSAIVVPQTVQLGDRSRGQVEILSGLRPGDRYVLRSSGPLQGGDRVRLSFISQPASP
ncbi:MAG: efflux RND transporter periplasmic adaptor subunit [Cyanophyceae cyanobacterium]